MGPWCAEMGVSGWVAMGAVWIAVIAIAIWLVGRLFPASGREDPRSVLDERLARGEVDTETYRRVRQELDETAATETRAAR